MDELRKMLQLNVDEVEPETISRLEKKRVMNHVLKKRRKGSFRYIAAACLLAGGIGSTLVFLSPTIASQIPIVNYIVEYFNEETIQFQYFEDYATGVGLVQDRNGIKIEIADAVYDGTTITISFAIESDKDLGEHPYLQAPILINGEREVGSITWTKKISDSTYVGVITLTPELHGRSPRTVNISWSPIIENTDTFEEFEGNWLFEFKLKKIDLEGIRVKYKDTKNDFTYKISKVELSGYAINIPFTIDIPSQYKYFPIQYGIDFEVKDELGNTYEMITGHTSSGSLNPNPKGIVSFANLHSGAKKLTITPKIINYDDETEMKFDSFTVDLPVTK